jgi:iron uptake system component EfeO
VRRLLLAVVAAAIVVVLAALAFPGPAAAAKQQTVAVKLTPDGCPKPIKVKPGSVTFKVSNDGADNVSEFEVLQGNKIVGEVENIAPGLSRSFTLKLKAGSYVTYCPGGDTREKGELTVSTPAAKATPTTTAPPTTSG